MTWWLEVSVSDSDSELSSDFTYYLMVNSERARSKSTKKEYGKVVDIRQGERDGQIQFVFADKKATIADMADMNATLIEASLGQAIGSRQELMALFSDSSEPEVNSPPLYASTPIPNRKRKRCTSNQPNSKMKENATSLSSKCIGVFKVSTDQLLNAPQGLLLRSPTEDQVKEVRQILEENPRFALPVIPVKTTTMWDGDIKDHDRFIVVGGNALVVAASDLSTDDKFAEYRHMTVRLYGDLTTEELHQVEALFQLQPLLMRDGKDTLQDKVHSFRDLLFKLSMELDSQEPPKSTVEWRRLCAASIGRSTDRKLS